MAGGSGFHYICVLQRRGSQIWFCQCLTPSDIPPGPTPVHTSDLRGHVPSLAMIGPAPLPPCNYKNEGGGRGGAQSRLGERLDPLLTRHHFFVRGVGEGAWNRGED